MQRGTSASPASAIDRYTGSRAPLETDAALASRITRSASRQAYYIARFLADRDRRHDAYRAYAYFRWVDDWLDQNDFAQQQRLAFVTRQQWLIDACYAGDRPDDLTPEERMLANLIDRDDEANSDLRSYIRNMMAVMAFDADRRGRLISGQELADYTRHLAVAVTDAMHYFIDHDSPTAHDELRYTAAMGAHITHMLRDTLEDATAGYFNVPAELLEAHGIGPHDVFSAPYRNWIRDRATLARACFKTGVGYLNRVQGLRCRIAGFAYMERFTGILDAIERENYYLRPSYADVSGLRYGVSRAGSVCAHAFLRGAI